MRANTSLSAAAILRRLHQLGDAKVAEGAGRFFKSGPGDYGEGDRFLGVRMPVQRALVREYRGLALDACLTLLGSHWHEARSLALLLMVDLYRHGDEPLRRNIYTAYLANTGFINNWDLVDSSAHLIVGPWLETRSRRPLFRLARSPLLWERRIAVLATLHFIRGNDFSTTLELVEGLLNDEEDLMHKACGWMLREVGRRARDVETAFLDKHSVTMPRTMLRYAIEHYPPKTRQAYLRGER